MKKSESILLPAFISALALSAAVACAPNKDVDGVNARRGQKCDNTKTMCDAATLEGRFAKVAPDTLLEDLKKELATEKDPYKRKLNQKAAEKISRIGLLIQDTKATVNVVDAQNTTTVLSGNLQNKSAELSSEDGLTKGRLTCVDAEGKCTTARLDLVKSIQLKENILTAKDSGRMIQGQITESEKTAVVQIKAIVRDLSAEVLTSEQDTTGKSDSFKKIYNLIRAKSAGSHDQNSVKSVLVQTSEVANGRSTLSALVVSNENEVIGFEGQLLLVAKGTEGKTSQDFKLVVNQDLLKKAALTGETKKTIADSVHKVTLTSTSVGQFAFQVVLKGQSQSIESLNLNLTISASAISVDTATASKGALKTQVEENIPLDGYLFGESELVQAKKSEIKVEEKKEEKSETESEEPKTE